VRDGKIPGDLDTRQERAVADPCGTEEDTAATRQVFREVNPVQLVPMIILSAAPVARIRRINSS